MSYQIGQKVRIISRRPSVEQYRSVVGEVVEIPTQGLIRVVLGRLSIAFTPDELEPAHEQQVS